MIIEISNYIKNKCEKFAVERIKNSKSLYSYRGESREEKMIEDVVVGTSAEWGVYKALRDNGLECSKPDMKHYSVRNKSFSADLESCKGLIHVKSQSIVSAERYGASWLFQKTDKLFRDEKSKDYLAFCLVDGKNVEIKAIVKVSDIIKNDIIGEPKVWKYKHTKCAIYLEDVLNSKINKRRLLNV